MLNLVWRENARAGLRAITAYIAERNPAAAERMLAAFEDCADRLPSHPYMYRAGRVSGTREAIVHPNYILIYRILPDTVEVLNIRHTRRQYP